MTRKIQLAFLFLACWAIGALSTWQLTQTEAKLVGLAARPPKAESYPSLHPDLLEQVQETLQNTSLWGVQRNGQAFPPRPAAGAAAQEEKPVEWVALGTMLRQKEKYLVIQIDKKPATQVKEGEALPNGAKLLKVFPYGYQMMNAEGKKEMIRTNL